MSLTLGEKLRQAREERGVSISEVAEQTRISAQYLGCIENDDYRTLPGGIFNKGFVKSFAKVVGIDEQEALQDYAQLIANQGSPVADEPKTYRSEVMTDDRSSSSSLPTIIIAVVILGLMTAGILAFLNFYNKETVPAANTTVNTNANANTATNTALTNTNTAPPVTTANEIKFEFKPTSDTINVTYWMDGAKMVSRDIKPDAPLSLNPQQSLKVSYYRGFTPDKVQITLNGKQIPAPAALLKGNTVFEINKENVAQILQSGQFVTGAPPAPAAPR